jgi:hypothetical protein
MNDLLSERQTAKLVKLKPKALRILREHGFGPLWVKTGGRIRYKAASVGEYVAACSEAFDLQDLSD